MSRARDLRCVICGKKADETGSAKKIITAARGVSALAHLNCYGSSQADIEWTDWLLAVTCGLTPPKPGSSCPTYLVGVVGEVDAQ